MVLFPPQGITITKSQMNAGELVSLANIHDGVDSDTAANTINRATGQKGMQG